MSKSNCINCNTAGVETLLDLGLQPPSNRYVPLGEEDVDLHGLRLGQCVACGLMQLVDPMPIEMVRPRYLWIKYNEPAGHLDALVGHLAKLVSSDAKIAGITHEDDSTLKRFNQRGYLQTFNYDIKSYFGMDAYAEISVRHSAIDDFIANKIIEKHGKADILVARYVLEHSHDPARFLNTLGQLLAPGGILVLEVPDSRKFVNACDYSFLWEEHISYFTPKTLEDFVRRRGFCTIDTLISPYPLEDSLAIFVQQATDFFVNVKRAIPSQDIAAGRIFARQFVPACMRYRRHLESLQEAGKRIAIFGAGHLAANFLNFFRLKDFVEYVIDDDPNKQGFAMPGSGAPILSSAHLKEIDVCLLALNPESEKKVLEKQRAYVERGGIFKSIFSLSPLAINST